MSTLAEFTTPKLIVPTMRSRDAAGTVAELSSTLYREGFVPDLLPFYHEVISHENLSSTAIAPGWGLPHARLAGLQRLAFAFGRTVEPMPWFGGSEQQVRLVFLFAVPEEQGGEYQTLLAGVARLMQRSGAFSAIIDAPGTEELLTILEQITLGHPRSARLNV